MAMNLCYRPIISGMLKCRYAFFLHLSYEDKGKLFRIAASQDKLVFVSLVIEHGFKPTLNELVLACANGHAEVCKILLLLPYIDPSDDISGTLFISCERNWLHVVKALINDGRVIARPSDRLNACLYQSIAEDHYHIAEMLIKCENVDPSWSRNIILQLAVSLELHNMVRLILGCGRVKIGRSEYDWFLECAKRRGWDSTYNVLKEYESVVSAVSHQ
jgi:hypothetical protein